MAKTTNDLIDGLEKVRDPMIFWNKKKEIIDALRDGRPVKIIDETGGKIKKVRDSHGK